MSVRTLVKSIQDIMRQDSGVDGDAQRISQLCWMFFLKIIDDQDQELELMRPGYRSPIPERFQWRTWAANPEGMLRQTGITLTEGDRLEISPAATEWFASVARGLHRGYAIGDGPAKLIASMTGTMMVVRGREGITG